MFRICLFYVPFVGFSKLEENKIFETEYTIFIIADWIGKGGSSAQQGREGLYVKRCFNPRVLDRYTLGMCSIKSDTFNENKI